MDNKTYIITTCCKDKDEAIELLPAIHRYLSERIRWVYDISIEEGLPMLIFSGKYGLLQTEAFIPYYDKKLEKEDVSMIVGKLMRDFNQFQIGKVVFYGRAENTEGWEPYYQAIREVCTRLQILLEEHITHLD